MRICVPQNGQVQLSNSRICDGDIEEIAIDIHIGHLTNITSLCLDGNNISDSGAIDIAGFLGKLITLSLERNHIGDFGAKHLATALRYNSSLKKLSFDGNVIIGDGSMSEFQVMLKHNKTLTSLSLALNNIGPRGAMTLSQGLSLNDTLTHLDLSYNHIKDEGAIAIADCLRHNSSLEKLDLKYCLIGEDGTKALASCLVVCQLKHLSLKYNRVSEAGGKAFAKALLHTPQLKTLDLSFTCLNDVGCGAIGCALAENAALTRLDIGGVDLGTYGTQQVCLSLRYNHSLRVLSFKLNCQVAAAFSEMMQCNNALEVVKVVIDDECEDGNAAEAAIASMVHNTSVTDLDIESFDKGSRCGVALATVLTLNAKLQRLCFRGEIGGPGAIAVGKALALNTCLRDLFLDDNGIGDDGMRSLSSALFTNNTLRCLGVNDNGIGDAGALAMVSALRVNTGLRELYMAYNDLTHRGEHAVEEVIVESNMTLTTFSPSKSTSPALAKAISRNQIYLQWLTEIAHVLLPSPSLFDALRHHVPTELVLPILLTLVNSSSQFASVSSVTFCKILDRFGFRHASSLVTADDIIASDLKNFLAEDFKVSRRAIDDEWKGHSRSE